MAGRAILLVVVVVMFASSSAVQASSVPVPPVSPEDFTCKNVTTAIAPCVEFLTGTGDAPSPNCCRGVKRVADMGDTKADRQAICKCLKSQAERIPTLDPKRASELPKKCNMTVDEPISPDVDCSK